MKVTNPHHASLGLLVRTSPPTLQHQIIAQTSKMILRNINKKAVRIISACLVTALIGLICWLSGIGIGEGSEFQKQLNAGISNLPSSFSSSQKEVVKVIDTYDKTTPPSTGCEAVVSDLQSKIIKAYGPVFEGIRHINMFGYLGMCILLLLNIIWWREWMADSSETENKGDAAIWTAQQILFSLFGIETMQACRCVCSLSFWGAMLMMN
jgi:hypothetical protein